VTDRHPLQVIACWPADRREIALLNRGRDPAEQFAPTVEHSLSHCDGCPRQIWIANQQHQLVGSPLMRVRKLCVYCAGDVQAALKMTMREVDLNRSGNPARRRTT
jgi:hypothetical protein